MDGNSTYLQLNSSLPIGDYNLTFAAWINKPTCIFTMLCILLLFFLNIAQDNESNSQAIIASWQPPYGYFFGISGRGMTDFNYYYYQYL